MGQRENMLPEGINPEKWHAITTPIDVRYLNCLLNEPEETIGLISESDEIRNEISPTLVTFAVGMTAICTVSTGIEFSEYGVDVSFIGMATLTTICGAITLALFLGHRADETNSNEVS